MADLRIISVNISEEKGVSKRGMPEMELTATGAKGDAHAGYWNRQVSLLGMESIRRCQEEANREFVPGDFAENLTTEGMELWKMHPLDRLTSGEVELEITQIGKSCHGSGCAIFREVGNCVMPKEGIFARVLHPGVLKPGDEMDYHPRMYRALVITLSDRAASGEYEDRSGPRIQELLTNWFQEKQLNLFLHPYLIPDDPHALEDLLHQGKNELIDLVITTGGTGIGPRDFTVDVVKEMLDYEIPGIMEAIRIKYGTLKPQALLSRSVAGVMGKTLVFTLPGSVRAVDEYLEEILKSLQHMIHMLHGLDSH